ncbi:hypothetical protein ACWD4F_26360 [Streptomyces aureus]
MHFHDLRHTGNTLAASTGASTRELMARMGHSTARAALIHQHASADRDRLIADAVSGLVKKGRKRGACRSKKKDQKPNGHAAGTEADRSPRIRQRPGGGIVFRPGLLSSGAGDGNRTRVASLED